MNIAWLICKLISSGNISVNWSLRKRREIEWGRKSSWRNNGWIFPKFNVKHFYISRIITSKQSKYKKNHMYTHHSQWVENQRQRKSLGNKQREKVYTVQTVTILKMMDVISFKMIEARRQWNYIFKVLKEKQLTDNSISRETIPQHWGWKTKFSSKFKKWEFIATGSTLHKCWKGSSSCWKEMTLHGNLNLQEEVKNTEERKCMLINIKIFFLISNWLRQNDSIITVLVS